MKRQALDVFILKFQWTCEEPGETLDHPAATFFLNKSEMEDIVRKGLSTLAAMPEEYCKTVEEIDGIKR